MPRKRRIAVSGEAKRANLAKRQRDARAEETEEQQTQRRFTHTKRMAMVPANETAEQQAERRSADAAGHSASRAAMTAEARREQRNAAQQRMLARGNCTRNVAVSDSIDESQVEEDYLGTLDLLCDNCHS